MQKKTSMTRKCHYHRPQTNLWHYKEEIQPHDNSNIFKVKQSALFLSKMITKLEVTVGLASQNKDNTHAGSNKKQKSTTVRASDE